MYFILRWLLNSFILILVAYLTPGVSFQSFWSALITAAVFGIINAFIRPLMLILTLPVNILTLGLFTLVINALMFWLTSAVVRGFQVSGFAAAFWGALIYWLIVTIINFISEPEKAK